MSSSLSTMSCPHCRARIDAGYVVGLPLVERARTDNESRRGYELSCPGPQLGTRLLGLCHRPLFVFADLRDMVWSRSLCDAPACGACQDSPGWCDTCRPAPDDAPVRSDGDALLEALLANDPRRTMDAATIVARAMLTNAGAAARLECNEYGQVRIHTASIGQVTITYGAEYVLQHDGHPDDGPFTEPSGLPPGCSDLARIATVIAATALR
jgi:hypothetical protein